MKVKSINKTDVMSMLTNDNLYVIRVFYKEYDDGSKVRNCYIKHVNTMPVNKVIEATTDINAAFIEIEEESV